MIAAVLIKVGRCGPIGGGEVSTTSAARQRNETAKTPRTPRRQKRNKFPALSPRPIRERSGDPEVFSLFVFVFSWRPWRPWRLGVQYLKTFVLAHRDPYSGVNQRPVFGLTLPTRRRGDGPLPGGDRGRIFQHPLRRLFEFAHHASASARVQSRPFPAYRALRQGTGREGGLRGPWPGSAGLALRPAIPGPPEPRRGRVAARSGRTSCRFHHGFPQNHLRPGHKVVGDRPDGVDVRQGRDRFRIFHRLRRQVMRGAHGHVGLGQLGRFARVGRLDQPKSSTFTKSVSPARAVR